MKPVSPTVPGTDLPLSIFGADQSEYQPLPAYRVGDENKTVVSRWRLSWRERLRVLISGNILLSRMTFGHPIQPSMLDTKCPLEIKK